jgi:hypothetical protein
VEGRTGAHGALNEQNLGMSDLTTLRLAAGLLVLTGLGFGLPCLWGIWHLRATGEVWTFLGFPTYGDGPFSRHGIPTTVPLLVGFLAVCVVETVAGVRVWGGHLDGAVVALALLPVEAAFWWGFALPIPPVFALVRTVLLAVGWRGLG